MPPEDSQPALSLTAAYHACFNSASISRYEGRPRGEFDPEVLYRELNVPQHHLHYYSTQEVLDHLERQIQQILRAGPGEAVLEDADYRAIHKQLVLEHLLDQTSTLPFVLLQHLWDVCRKDLEHRDFTAEPHGSESEGHLVALEQKERWQKALTLARHQSALSPFLEQTYGIEGLGVPLGWQRLAEALAFYRGEGCPVPTVDGQIGQIGLGPAPGPILVQRLETGIAALGAERVIEHLFETLALRFRPSLSCYLLSPEFEGNFGEHTPAGIPYGFLLELCLKSLGQHATPPARKSSWTPAQRESAQSLLLEARHFATLFELQSYNPFENLSLAPENALQELHSVMLYDQLYAFPQFPLHHLARTLEGLLGWFDTDQLKSVSGVSASDVAVWLTAWLGVAQRGQILRVDTKSPLYLKGVEDLGMAAWSLWNIFSQPASGLNQSLSWPFENSTWGMGPCPFLAWGSSSDPHYWGFDPHWRSAAVLEGGYAVVRELDPEQGNSHLGDAFEHLVRSDLSQRGVTLHHGKVQLGKGSELECDVLLESQNFLIFVELKRKALTFGARQGDSLTLLIDLVNSFLYAQTQAIRLEGELRARGKLHFQGSGTGVAFKGQRCLRLSLTLDSYGRLHDVHLIQKLFQAAYLGDFSIPSSLRTPERDAQLESVKAGQHKFRKYANQLSALPGYATARDPLGVLRHDAAFLGLAEWWTLLEHLPGQPRGSDFVNALANKLLDLALERSPSSDVYRRLLGETQGYPTFVRAPS